MTIETAHYIIRFFPKLMTEMEATALRQNNSMLKLLSPEDLDSTASYQARVKWYNERNYITNDPYTLNLLKEGEDSFYIQTAKRIFDQAPEKIFFNYCPNCNGLARTPYARQCKDCGHSWHNTIQANFKINKVIDLRSKPSSLFFIGDIKSGAIKPGMKIDLTFLGVPNKPIIKSINFVDHIEVGSAEVALEVEMDTNAEKAYLLDHGVLAIPVIIEA